MKGGKKKNFATLNFVSVGQCFIYRETASAASDSLVANGEESMERILELERELNAARSSIAEKEAKCNRLSELQDHIDSEVQELTEKLFQVHLSQEYPHFMLIDRLISSSSGGGESQDK